MKRNPHYVDVGHEPPDPGGPTNLRILAALEEAISRGDSALLTLDAVDGVLSELAKGGERASAPLDGALHHVVGKDSVRARAKRTRGRHAHPASRARAAASAAETPTNLDVETGRERSDCGDAEQDTTTREVA